MANRDKKTKTSVYEINAPFQLHWEQSGVEEQYLNWVNEKINELIQYLFTFNPDEVSLGDYKESIQGLAYTTTELMAQFCAGGFCFELSDKARFLSPTVDLQAIIRERAINEKGSIGEYFESVNYGVWEFLEVSEETNNWIEVQKLNKQQISYLLWSAKNALQLLNAEERIPGFTNLVLSEPRILDEYIKCESPIESILYMQLIMDGLRPPMLITQYWIETDRVDFAIPSASIAIECDGKKYHDNVLDALRDARLRKLGWNILHFSSKKIIIDPRFCSAQIYDEFEWDQ